MKIDEKIKTRIRNGELAKVVISSEYFREGDYTDWQDQSGDTASMTQEEYADWLVRDMKKYDSIVLYSDGTLYGNIGRLSYDISYEEFDFGDVETFISLTEKFGIGDMEFS